MSAKDLIQAIAVTSELCGTNLSEPAQRMLFQDLSTYPEVAVIAALSKCRRELKGRLTLSEIISRIDDGRPGPEEAWAMIPRDESATIVWTEEMCAAWAIADQLIQQGEEVAARMAFKETYTRALAEARDERKPVCWRVSLGHDANGREAVLCDAVRKGRLTTGYVSKLLPHHKSSPEFLGLLEKAESEIKQIEAA